MNTTVKEIVIPSDKLENIRRIEKSKAMWFTRRDRLKAAAGFSPFCCVCHEISSPLYQVRYPVGGMVRIEIYCNAHIETYHKTKDKTNEEIARSYGLEIGVPEPTHFDPWDKPEPYKR